MSSRMDKYNNSSTEEMSRVKRNETIYSSTDMNQLSRIRTNTNVSIISDAPKEIDLDKIRNYVYSMEENENDHKSRVSLELPPEKETVIPEKEEKDYDINTVLERARDKRNIDYEVERHRKINTDATQKDILKNIKLREALNEEIDPDITGPIDELNTEEKTIIDLIQNIQNHKKNKKELFDDLMGDDGDETVVMGMAPSENELEKENLKEALFDITQDLDSIKEPGNEFTKDIKAEIESLKTGETQDLTGVIEEITGETPKITNVDKSFFTNSITFNKSDFEGFEELEKSAKKSSIGTKIAVIFVVLLLLATIFLVLNYVLEWNLI